ncbi:MAG: DUF937 domain-containing protein [Chlorobi bacterium]|nr:DUF937 domain-containing protein [Chlorobiota bacterium]
MDIASLIQLGASVIQGNNDKNTTSIPLDKISSALGNLLGGSGKMPDFGNLISKMQGSGLGEIAASWLGKGENKPVSPDAVAGIVGLDRLKDFASQLGISEESAKTAVADALPEMVDKASPEGSLLDDLFGNIGGMKGLGDIAGKFL